MEHNAKASRDTSRESDLRNFESGGKFAQKDMN